MKVTVEPITGVYKGLNNYKKFGICLGKKTTTKGYLWWKEVETEYVWCVMGATYCVEDWQTCSEDWFWGVIDHFGYDYKNLAEGLLEDLRGGEYYEV